MKTVSKVLTLIAAVICVCYCEDQPNLSAEKKIFDSVERKEPKEVDFSKSPLLKLDEQIQQELRIPKASDVSFEVKLDVLKNLVEYEKNIRELYQGVQNNVKSGVELAKDLLCQDGPTFLREEIDEEKLKKIYNWDDDNIDHLKDLFKDIRSVYNNITNITCEESKAILDLDRTIATKLTNPAFQDGISILSELLNLHILLNEVSQKFKENNEKAWQIMETLDDAGGLKLLKAPINGTRIQQVLQWPDNKVQDIKSALMGISALWRDLYKSSREPPHRNDNHPKDIKFHFEPVLN